MKLTKLLIISFTHAVVIAGWDYKGWTSPKHEMKPIGPSEEYGPAQGVLRATFPNDGICTNLDRHETFLPMWQGQTDVRLLPGRCASMDHDFGAVEYHFDDAYLNVLKNPERCATMVWSHPRCTGRMVTVLIHGSAPDVDDMNTCWDEFRMAGRSLMFDCSEEHPWTKGEWDH